MKFMVLVRGFVLGVALLLAVWDFLSVYFVVMSGEGWWNGEKLSGWEAIRTLAPLFAAQAVLEATAFYILHQGYRPWIASFPQLLQHCCTSMLGSTFAPTAQCRQERPARPCQRG
ncbi:hypothetical protein [Hyperthermus butylicus]|uniref:hypothetical protein n=1 Tax=Hyperthermus butylicus TaxID=54248 RepID=UPI00064FD423|nr:hypothetical protein [Hyperthermus butylicus]